MRSRWTGLGGALAVLVVSALTLPYSFSGDIRYEMGVKSVSEHSAADTFTHRPLLYRLATAAITAPAQGAGGSIRQLEVILRAECVVLALLAASLLWLGLRRRVGADAVPVALVVAAALVLMGPQITLEPEWLAVVLAVLGLGAALALPNRVAAAAVGGTLLAAAAATKIVTLPIALVGLLALLLLDRRRALWTTAAAGAAGLVYVAAVLALAPHEIDWLLDMRSVQPAAVPLTTTLTSTLELLGNAATLWPSVALLPAALVGSTSRAKIAAIGAAALAWLPAQIQGQYFIYHLAALPVVTAVVLVLALRRAPATFAVLTLGYAGWVAWVSSTPAGWRAGQVVLIFAVTGATTVGLWLYRLRSASPPATRDQSAPAGRGGASRSGTVGSAAAVAAVLVTTLAASTPFAAGSISLGRTERYTPVSRLADTRTALAATDRVRTHIGAGTEVTYLTFGDYSYYLRNPTNCRYPSPVFLQRSRPHVGSPPSRAWTETLSCITDTPGEWLIWDRSWFRMSRQPPVVQDAITRTFDCDKAFEQGPIRACPRRAPG